MTESIKNIKVNSPTDGFTDEFLTHAYTPQNVGVMTNPDGFGAPRGACGDSIEIGLKINDGVIENALFMTDGCAHTVACGSVITTLARGLSVKEALEVGPERIVEALGGLPRAHLHCARLAVTTLRLAVKDFLKNQDAPWKKLYRPAGTRG